MARKFHPYVRMVYDTDRPFSDFAYIPRLPVEELPNEIAERGEKWISSDMDVYVRDVEMNRVFKVLKTARKEVMQRNSNILCSDVLLDYPQNIERILEDDRRENRVTIDVAYRENSRDRLCDRGGQAFFEVHIGFNRDPRICSLSRGEDLRREIEESDRGLERALMDYLKTLKDYKLTVKPGTSHSDLFNIVKNFFK